MNEAVDKSERLSNWNFELSEAQLEYAARDAAILLPLREKLIERLRSDSLVAVAQLEFECVTTVADIELAGFYMHKDRWLEQMSCRTSWQRSRRKGRYLVARNAMTLIWIRTSS